MTIPASWTIRTADASDATALSALAERTFRDAFASANEPGDVDLHCAQSYAPAIQAAEIADPLRSTVVVEHEGALVAYVQVCRRPAPAGDAETPAVQIGRFYVLQAWHGSGVAQALMDDAVARARRMGASILWLGVWEHNPRAIRFYAKHGFTTVGEQPFVLGTDPQRDLVMVRRLAAAGEPSP